MTADRISWLKGIIQSYQEDEVTFGLTAPDLCRLANFRAELKDLESKTGDNSPSP